MVGTHTLKISCVCTDQNTIRTARNLLKTLDTRGFTYDCVINTTTLIPVSSRTHMHALKKQHSCNKILKMGSSLSA